MGSSSSAPPGKPSLSIIVPVHQGGESFYRCLLSLSKTSPTPIEVILVQDGCGNGISEIAAQFGFKLIRIPDRSGPVRTRNLGDSQARGDILLFIASDVIIPQDITAKVQLAFTQPPGPAAVFGSYDDEPAASNFLSQYRNLFHHYVHQTSNEDASAFWGACGVIRREVFEKLGGFDESYRRPSIEDIELGSRAKRAGYKILLSKTLQCKHLKCYSPLSLLKSDFFDRALP